MTRNIIIPVGGIFQEKDCLIDLLEKDKVRELEKKASDSGWCKVMPSQAESMGFNELVEWSLPETDVLVLIDENFLVCIPKKLYCAAEC